MSHDCEKTITIFCPACDEEYAAITRAYDDRDTHPPEDVEAMCENCVRDAVNLAVHASETLLAQARADADALRVIITHKDAAIAELRDRVAKKDRLLDEARTQLRSRRLDVQRLAKTLRGVADELTDNKET